MDHSPADYQSFFSSRVSRTEVSPDMRQDVSEQSMTLPILIENLRIDTAESHMSPTPIQAAVTTADYSLEYMLQLRSFLQSKAVLEAKGYILHELSEIAIERKKKCQRCGKSISKGKANDKDKGEDKRRSLPNQNKNEGTAGLQLESSERSGNEVEESRFELQSWLLSKDGGASLAQQPAPNPNSLRRCRFHDGVLKYKMWSCCRKNASSDPCKEKDVHVSRYYPKGQLESAWKFHITPGINISSTIRPAVAIDCEMGIARSGDPELIRVTLIDYFSSEILIDSLVYPDVAMEHYNTRYSGVTGRQMDLALGQGRCLLGKAKAREAVWQFVGPNTVVVGHSAQNDLTAMRWMHLAVVDTLLIESIRASHVKAKVEAEQEKKEIDSKKEMDSKKEIDSPKVASIDLAEKPKEVQQEKPKRKAKGSGPLSLKSLTMARWGREIQNAGNKGHDSLEDAIASRDLAHWNIINKIF